MLSVSSSSQSTKDLSGTRHSPAGYGARTRNKAGPRVVAGAARTNSRRYKRKPSSRATWPIRQVALHFEQAVKLGSIHNEVVLHDLRFTVRALRRSPRFSLAVVTTLGVGLGVASSLFGLVDRLIVSSAYGRAPDRVVRLALAEESPYLGEFISMTLSAIDHEMIRPYERISRSGCRRRRE